MMANGERSWLQGRWSILWEPGLHQRSARTTPECQAMAAFDTEVLPARHKAFDFGANAMTKYLLQCEYLLQALLYGFSIDNCLCTLFISSPLSPKSFLPFSSSPCWPQPHGLANGSGAPPNPPFDFAGGATGV